MFHIGQSTHKSLDLRQQLIYSDRCLIDAHNLKPFLILIFMLMDINVALIYSTIVVLHVCTYTNIHIMMKH